MWRTLYEIPDPRVTAHICSRAGLAMLGHIDEKFVEVVDVMEPLASGSQDAAFISRGYDATSHFETTARPGPARQLPAAHHGRAVFHKFLMRAIKDMECRRLAAWRSTSEPRKGMPPVRDVTQRLESVEASKECSPKHWVLALRWRMCWKCTRASPGACSTCRPRTPRGLRRRSERQALRLVLGVRVTVQVSV